MLQLLKYTAAMYRNLVVSGIQARSNIKLESGLPSKKLFFDGLNYDCLLSKLFHSIF